MHFAHTCFFGSNKSFKVTNIVYLIQSLENCSRTHNLIKTFTVSHETLNSSESYHRNDLLLLQTNWDSTCTGCNDNLIAFPRVPLFNQ